MPASNVQQDGGRVRRAAGRKALSLLCSVDEQDRYGGGPDAGMLDQCRRLLRPADLCQE